MSDSSPHVDPTVERLIDGRTPAPSDESMQWQDDLDFAQLEDHEMIDSENVTLLKLDLPSNLENESSGADQDDKMRDQPQLERSNNIEHAQVIEASTVYEDANGDVPEDMALLEVADVNLDENDQDEREQILEGLDFAQLQEAFGAEMSIMTQKEGKYIKQLQKLMTVYLDWSMASAQHEESRAAKRLRTRISYVENCEVQLEKKRSHVDKVHQAFAKAMQLLSDPMG